jgi:hypothetical protein
MQGIGNYWMNVRVEVARNAMALDGVCNGAIALRLNVVPCGDSLFTSADITNLLGKFGGASRPAMQMGHSCSGSTASLPSRRLLQDDGDEIDHEAEARMLNATSLPPLAVNPPANASDACTGGNLTYEAAKAKCSADPCLNASVPQLDGCIFDYCLTEDDESVNNSIGLCKLDKKMTEAAANETGPVNPCAISAPVAPASTTAANPCAIITPRKYAEQKNSGSAFMQFSPITIGCVSILLPLAAVVGFLRYGRSNTRNMGGPAYDQMSQQTAEATDNGDFSCEPLVDREA